MYGSFATHIRHVCVCDYMVHQSYICDVVGAHDVCFTIHLRFVCDCLVHAAPDFHDGSILPCKDKRQYLLTLIENCILLCKVKRPYLLTYRSSGYCLLAVHESVVSGYISVSYYRISVFFIFHNFSVLRLLVHSLLGELVKY